VTSLIGGSNGLSCGGLCARAGPPGAGSHWRPQCVFYLPSAGAVFRRAGSLHAELLDRSKVYIPSGVARGRIGAAKISAEHARQRAKEAAQEADRAETYAWSVRMEG
jgi:hypothetical protein